MEIYRYKTGFEKEELSCLNGVVEELNSSIKSLQNLSYEKIIDAWAELGKQFSKHQDFFEIEGILFLMSWLSRENMKNILLDSLRIESLDNPEIKLKSGGVMKPFSRGLVVQWLAGNSQTLPVFAMFQSSLTKNSAIIRASRRNIKFTLDVLKLFSTLGFKEILENIIIVYFPHDDKKSHEMLSEIADCKVFWGDSGAINFVKTLKEKETAESIIFGPKYSLSLIDKESQENNLEELMSKTALDIILFDQMACSSSQMIFAEKNKDIKEIAKILASALVKVSLKYPKKIIREDLASKIINKRAEYLLNPKLEMISSKENDWTILIGGDFKLEEAVQSRTVYIKEVESLEKVAELVNPKIQTVGLSIKNPEKAEKISSLLLQNGVSRIVSPGKMNDYGVPWDGLLVLDRLIRWCLFKN